jgi:hypothetical protein
MTNQKIWAGNPSNLSKIDGGSIFNEIPNGIWEPYSTIMGTFLAKRDSKFEFSHKIYGIEHDFIKHVIITYEKSEKNVGILMNGTKGAGKTVTAKTLANMSGLPIILVNSNNIDILSYFDDVKQPLCFFFDEFEKIINHNDDKVVAPLLSFVDGTSSSTKHLMLFTSNESKISSYFLDRPGRIRYIKQYGSLNGEVIKEIVDDMLVHTEYRQDIIDWVVYFKYLTIDMLISIIKEVNIHNVSPKVFANFFNVNNEKPSFELTAHITHMVTGKKWEIDISRTFSDTTTDQLFEEFNDHDRSLPILGHIIQEDENKNKYLCENEYARELIFYIDMIKHHCPYYQEGKKLFQFSSYSFLDKIKKNLFCPDDSKSAENAWSSEDCEDLVIEFKFKLKNNYHHYAF